MSALAIVSPSPRATPVALPPPRAPPPASSRPLRRRCSRPPTRVAVDHGDRAGGQDPDGVHGLVVEHALRRTGTSGVGATLRVARARTERRHRAELRARRRRRRPHAARRRQRVERGGSASASSAPSSVVAPLPVAPPPAPVSTAAPAVSGTTQAGKTLTASNGSWSNAPSSYAYQWRRCDSAGGSVRRRHRCDVPVSRSARRMSVARCGSSCGPQRRWHDGRDELVVGRRRPGAGRARGSGQHAEPSLRGNDRRARR